MEEIIANQGYAQIRAIRGDFRAGRARLHAPAHLRRAFLVVPFRRHQAPQTYGLHARTQVCPLRGRVCFCR